jgi:hypothetical protein
VNDLDRRTATQSRNAVPQEVSGVLETLAAGFSLVVSRPYLFVLPLLVDLWTWLGVQIYPTALIESLQRVMIDQGGSNGADVARDLTDVGERLRVNDTIASLTPSIFAGLPNDTLLSMVIGLLAPALTDGVNRTEMYSTWGDGLGRVVTPSHWFGVVGIALLLFMGATFLLALFKVPLAQAVRGGRMTPGVFLRDVTAGWMRVSALIAILVVAIVVIVIPLAVVTQVFVLVGFNLVALIAIPVFVFGCIGALYTYFLLDAMFIYRVGPIRATRMSYAVARINFAQSWRFAAASLLIATGVLQVWAVIIENPPGIIAALVINAVLGTGLSLASMMFFHDRARLPRPVSQARTFPPTRR